MIAVGILLSLLIPVAVLGLVARFVIRRIGSEAPVARTLGAALHVLVMVAAVNAISGLVELAVPVDAVFEDTARIVAMNAAILAVSLPVSIVIWRSLFSGTTDFPRRFAVVTGLAVSLVTTLFSAVSVGRSLVGTSDLDPGSLGNLVAFGLAWAGYEWWNRRRESGAFEVDDLPSTAASASGLGLSVSAAVLLVETALSRLIGVSGDVIVERSLGEVLGTVGVLAVVGGAALTRYWLLDLRPRETRFRNGYAAVVSFVSLTVLASSAGSAALMALEWLVGVGEATAAAQFDGSPLASALAIAFVFSWLHHREIIAPRRGLAARAYSYATAATGVIAGVCGLVALLVLAVEGVTASAAVTTSENASLALASLLSMSIGGLLWWSQRRQMTAGEPAERDSTPRRFYLVGMLIITAIASAVSLIMALFGLLEALLESRFGLDVIFEGRFVIATVMTTAPLVWHFVEELRSDRARRPSEAPRREALVVASSLGALEAVEGVRLLRRVEEGMPVTEEMATEIVALVRSDGPPVLVVVAGEGFEAIELESVPEAALSRIFS